MIASFEQRLKRQCLYLTRNRPRYLSVLELSVLQPCFLAPAAHLTQSCCCQRERERDAWHVLVHERAARQACLRTSARLRMSANACAAQASGANRYKELEALVSARLHIASSVFPAMNLPWLGASIYGAATLASASTGSGASLTSVPTLPSNKVLTPIVLAHLDADALLETWLPDPLLAR